MLRFVASQERIDWRSGQLKLVALSRDGHRLSPRLVLDCCRHEQKFCGSYVGCGNEDLFVTVGALWAGGTLHRRDSLGDGGWWRLLQFEGESA